MLTQIDGSDHESAQNWPIHRSFLHFLKQSKVAELMEFRSWQRGLLILLIPINAWAAEFSYPDVTADVSYEQVLALPWRDSDNRVSYGPDPLQFGRLWRPADGNESAATLVLIHGGCWLNSFDMSHSYALATALAAAGYAVWSLEYRRSGDAGGGWPGSFEDVQAGINTLRQLPDIALDRIALLGHSAGGHLALLAGARQEELAVELDLVVGLAAITDVIDYAAGDNSCQLVTTDFMGGTPRQLPEQYRQANPASHGLHANTVLLHGDNDAIVPLQQTELVDAELVLSPGAGHFDWTHPGTVAFQQLLQLLADRL
jgi:acetyl esterase/lipase